MSRRRIIQLVVGAIAGIALAWAAMRGLERLIRPRPAPPPVVATQPAPATAHITATLFYVSDDGLMLVPVKREVPLAEGVVAQGREIVESELEAPEAPYVSPMPKGTMLRAFYVTERGDAFVDLSPEVSRAHPGGTAAELLTVYAIVNAVATNLPAVQRVQILVDGKPVDTIAGHVDIRRPLQRNDAITQPAK
jgi:spore germination protein GerM